MPSEQIDQYENLLTGNPIWMGRLKGVGYLSAEDAIALGVTGPPLRASGVDWDLRRDMPYSSYEKFQFKVPTSTRRRCVGAIRGADGGDAESVKICQQALDGMPEGADCGGCAEDRSAGPRADEDADGVADPPLQDCDGGVCGAGGRGVPGDRVARADEMGYYVVSDGTAKPYRVHMRNPGLRRCRRSRRCARAGCWRMWWR